MFDNLKKIFSGSGEQSDSLTEDRETGGQDGYEDSDKVEAAEVSDGSGNSDKVEAAEVSDGSENSDKVEAAEASEDSHDSECSEDSEASENSEEVGTAAPRLTEEEAGLLAIVGTRNAEELRALIERGEAFEQAVEEARLEGERRGRCERIEEYISNGDPVGDGIPRLASNPVSNRRTISSIFDLAREA